MDKRTHAESVCVAPGPGCARPCVIEWGMQHSPRPRKKREIKHKVLHTRVTASLYGMCAHMCYLECKNQCKNQNHRTEGF